MLLFRGGRHRDTPGLKYTLIKGKLDFSTKEDFDREKRRSSLWIKE